MTRKFLFYIVYLILLVCLFNPDLYAASPETKLKGKGHQGKGRGDIKTPSTGVSENGWWHDDPVQQRTQEFQQ